LGMLCVRGARTNIRNALSTCAPTPRRHLQPYRKGVSFINLGRLSLLARWNVSSKTVMSFTTGAVFAPIIDMTS
jgi:hypothetical protein